LDTITRSSPVSKIGLSAIAAAYVTLFRSIPLVMVLLWSSSPGSPVVPLVVSEAKSDRHSSSRCALRFFEVILRENQSGRGSKLSKPAMAGNRAIGMTDRAVMRLVILPGISAE